MLSTAEHIWQWKVLISVNRVKERGKDTMMSEEMEICRGR